MISDQSIPVLCRCWNCGKECVDDGRGGICGPCEVALKAVQAPEVLRDMWEVYQGEEPRTPGQRMLQGLFQDNPNQFVAQMRTAEREWRSSIKGIKVKEKPQILEQEVDEGEQRVEDLIQTILDECSESLSGE